MNKIKMFGLLGVISLVLSACSHSTARQSDFLGEVSAEQLLAQYPTFQDEYESYKPSEKELAAVASLQDDSLVVLFGTWCHDSQREVPRLLKTFDLSGLDVPKLTLVAVDTKKNDPQGLAKKYALKYTPTFVLLKGDKELGRVIERPKMSLTEDLQFLSSMTK